MSSPIGHSLAGLIIYRVVHGPWSGIAWGRWALYVFAANAADLDFVPGILLGDPNRYHHGISHSIGFAILFGFIFSLLVYLFSRRPMKKYFVVFSVLYLSHIVLDLMYIDTSWPYGEPFFWPLSPVYFYPSFAFLPDIQRSREAADFFRSLFSLHNLWAVTVEILLLVSVIIVMWILQKPSRTSVLVGPLQSGQEENDGSREGPSYK